MDAYAPPCGGVLRPFDQMFFGRFACPFRIGVEGHQPLGPASVAESLADDVFDHGAVVGAGRQRGAQFGPEGEAFDVQQQAVDPLAAPPLLDEGEKLLDMRVAAPDAGTNLTMPSRAAASS